MNSIQGKLSTLSAITEIGQGFFECPNQKAATMYICVQSRKVIPFTRSIVTFRTEILAVSGQDQLSNSSPLKKAVKDLFRSVTNNDQVLILPGIILDTSILYIPLKCPVSKKTWSWFIEINEPQQFRVAAELLGKYFSLGMLHVLKKSDSFRYLRNMFSLPLFLGIFIIIACVYIKIPEKVIAPVIVKAKYSSAARSPIDGLIDDCVPEGRFVEKGTVLGRIDTTEYEHQLEETLKSRGELLIRINKTVNDSLKDKAKLIEVKLLRLEEDKINLKIGFLKDKINRNVIKAPLSGVVRHLSDISVNSDSNKGRFLKKGEVLCYVDNMEERVAEINIAESEIHVLQKNPELVIYYHNSPDAAQSSEILKVPQRPEINALTQSYIYPVMATTTEETGVTGIAHLRGSKVTLGYYLFKKIYFYIRGF